VLEKEQGGAALAPPVPSGILLAPVALDLNVAMKKGKQRNA
jgi:hypothetical protein